jgi:hypothetical protein
MRIAVLAAEQPRYVAPCSPSLVLQSSFLERRFLGAHNLVVTTEMALARVLWPLRNA